jgi:hypothetical protein
LEGLQQFQEKESSYGGPSGLSSMMSLVDEED